MYFFFRVDYGNASMDNCDLEKLTAAPAILSPKFDPNVVEYESTVASSVKQITFDCWTSDSGASYQIVVSLRRKELLLIDTA